MAHCLSELVCQLVMRVLLLNATCLFQASATGDLSPDGLRVDLARGVPILLNGKRVTFDEEVYLSVVDGSTLLVGSVRMQSKPDTEKMEFRRDYQQGHELFSWDRNMTDRPWEFGQAKNVLPDQLEFKLPPG